MRKNSEPLKFFLNIKQSSSLSNEPTNDKQSQKTVKNKINQNEQKVERDDLISNAYKNVIKVIENLLGNINDEKTDGKSNLQYINQASQRLRKASVNKKRIQKNISYTPEKFKSSFKKLLKKNSINKKPIYKLKSVNIIKRKKRNENVTDALNLVKKKKNLLLKKPSNKSNLQVKNSFFTPKNKLNEKWTSSKKTIFDENKSENEASFFSKKNKSNFEGSILFNSNKSNNSNNSSFSLFLENGSPKQQSKNLYINNINNIKNNSQKKIKSYFKSNIINKSGIKKSSSKSINVSPFENLQKSINIDTATIKQKLYEYENNELTHQINQMPDDYILKCKKRNQRKKGFTPFDFCLKSIINLKPIKSNYENNMVKFYKENKFRFLLSKGHVYDSLDDDEESDEEDIDICYLKPNHKFLYILDSITFISSIIMLIYFPICLAKRKFYCRYLNKDEIIFYSIDAIYIIDLIVNFYRSYYDYNEILIKKTILICIHYFKTWLLIDLISAIPLYTIIKSNETKCFLGNIYNDNKLSNNGLHSNHYNTNIQNIHYLLTLLKTFKSIKTFKHNLAVKKIKKNMFDIDFFYDWGSVFLYTFFFFTFLNFGACCFIIVGRNTINNWIYLAELEEKNFICIYLGAIHYLIETVTTVGYGDVIGKSIKEICFQVIMLIVGTCIYSWLISSISTYVKKMNEKNIKYEEKVQILEEIKLNNPNFTEQLYDKILRLLNYRKYHEEETEKNIVLNSIPNSLKNSLFIEMYKTFINGFLFFKGIENREFIVQVISKLQPILGIKGDVLIREGEFIEDIIFVKNGILSLEVWIDLDFPEDSIKDYLIENGFLNPSKNQKLKTQNNKERPSISSSLVDNNINYNNTNGYTNINKYYIFNEDRNIIKDNKKMIKVLDIRKNDHFGDVYMFLNKKSPLYVRVKSNKADLLLLKKLDALNISSNYPNIWKNILKKPLENTKILNNLTIKALSSFCNFNGIKTKLFKKKKNNKYYPSYYLISSLNKKNKHLKKSSKQKKDEKDDNKFFLTRKKDEIKLSQKNYVKKLSSKETQKKEDEINDNNNDINNTISIKDDDFSLNKKRRGKRMSQNFTFINKSNDSSLNNFTFGANNQSNNNKKNYNESNSLFTSIQNKNKINNINKKKDNDSYMIIIDNDEKNDSSNICKKPNSSKNNIISYEYKIEDNNSSYICNPYDIDKNDTTKKDSNLNRKNQQNPYKIIINKPEENNKIIMRNKIINKFSNNNLNLEINDEIYQDELFNIELFDDEKTKKKLKDKNIIENISNINRAVLSDGLYINNLNIIKANYLGSSSKKNKSLQDKIKELEFELKQKKKFNLLEISSSESTLEIGSSYENINEISNNKYISDNELRDMTKEFIIQKCKLSNNEINTDYGNKIYSSYDTENNNYFQCQTFCDKTKNSKFANRILPKIEIKKEVSEEDQFSNNLMNKFLKSIQNTKTNQAESFINKVRTLKPSEPAIKHSRKTSVQIRPSNTEKFVIDKKNTLLEDKRDLSKKKYEIFAKKTVENISPKKKKKKNELDIIQHNIQKTSQNLNQPEQFFAGLFSQLIFKGNSYENSKLNNYDKDENSNKYHNQNQHNKDSSFNSEESYS